MPERIPDPLYKAAVDALYQARSDGKVMDQAAVEVVLAIRKLLQADPGHVDLAIWLLGEGWESHSQAKHGATHDITAYRHELVGPWRPIDLAKRQSLT